MRKELISPDPEEGAEDVPKEKMFSAVVPIRAMQKFLTSHLVGGVAIACKLLRSLRLE